MEQEASFAALALAGVERVREKDREVRGRVSALPLLLRGAYYTGERKWRAFAEEDLRALWRGGVHDHVGGGFFSGSTDGEWLRPVFEKRLGDNAILALVFAEAWEKGRMGFYRAAAEEALEFCLRELADPSGLYRAGRFAASEEKENPFLFTPAQLAAALPGDEGRHFAECYDVTDEGNCGGGASIPNLILNERWSLVPEGWAELRERLRLAREARGGLLTEGRRPFEDNALLLAALARAGRVFSDGRFLDAAVELAGALAAAEESSFAARAALLFALTEFYAADFDPAQLAAAARIAQTLAVPAERGGVPSPGLDRALSLAALGLEALWRLSGEERWRQGVAGILLELGGHPARHGPESLGALCTGFSVGAAPRALLCVCPAEEPPAALAALRSRYAPDLAILLKTPARAAALAAAVPWTAEPPIGEETLFYPIEKAEIGPPYRP